MKITNMVFMLTLSVSAYAQNFKELPPFSSIALDAPCKVLLIQSPIPKAEFSAKIDMNVKNDILYISFSATPSNNAEVVKVYYTQLKSLEINGVGEVNIDQGSTIIGDAFKLECSGTAKTSLALQVKDLRIEGSDASKITLNGKAGMAKIELSGASKLFASELKTTDMKVEGSGASFFNVFASNSLHVDATGAVKGTYAGSPVTKNINVSGVSTIVDVTTGEQMTDERHKNGDTTRLSIGNMKVIIIDENDNDTVKTKHVDPSGENNMHKNVKRYPLKHVYAGFELGVSNFASPQLNLSVPASYSYLSCNIGRSWFYGLNIIEKDAQLIKNKLALTTGFGIEFQHFEFASDKVLQANVPGIMADSGLIHYTLNRLYNFNLNVPLLLKFAPRTRKMRNGFHIAAGLIGTFKAYSSLSLETSSKGFREEIKVKDDFNINPFRLAATVRVGYGWFRAFASYSLTPYFKQTNGNPDIRVFAAGITLVPFQ